VIALVRLTARGAARHARAQAGRHRERLVARRREPGPFTATYAATKAYVTCFSESLHEEVRGSGVTVQALLPGFTRTEFQEVAGVDPGIVPGFAWMSPEQVVEASLAALGRGDAVCIPGAGNRLLGGLTGLAPRASHAGCWAPSREGTCASANAGCRLRD